MELLVKRNKEPRHNFGKLYLDGQFFCDTLEDEDRGLENGGIKVKGQTAIPRGRYKVIIDWSPKFNQLMIHVLDVPGFSGIRIHSGTDEEDTEGCILVGTRTNYTLKNGLGASKSLRALVQSAIGRGEDVWLTVE